MALFSRKNRPHDDDNVLLGSTDHRWWTGDAAPADDALVGAERVDPASRPSDHSPATAGSSGVDPDLVGALAEFGYGDAAGSLLARSAPADLDEGPQAGVVGSGAPLRAIGPGQPATASEPGALVVDEGSLFVRDGLPAEDRMADLLGVLGLEKDAAWVDIARAHRRLAPVTGTAASDPGPERRAANEAYACLRLFHH